MQVTYKEKQEWVKRDFGSLVGKTIKTVRPLTKDECEIFGWEFDYSDYAMVLVCDDGTAIIPSRDPEGNGSGFLFVERVGE